MIIIKTKIPSYFLIILLVGSLFALDITRRVLSGDFEDDDYKLEVLYSSEKAGWLESIVTEFREDWSRNHEGTSVKMIMTPIGTAKGTIQIAQEALKPTIWSPASSFWLPYLNTLVKDSEQGRIVDENSPSMVVSPTVIATWQNYQNQHNITSMEDLKNLANTDPDFTFAHTDPFSSNSGFTAVIMQVAAASGKSAEDIELTDLEDEYVQQWMRDLQSSVIHYGSSTGFLARFMTSEGPSGLKATIVYENLVVEKNKELDFRIENGEIPASQKLVAVYPEEGILFNNHPFAIIDRPWVSPRERLLAEDFIDFLLKPEVQQRAVEYGFRPSIDVNPELLDAQFNEENGVRRNLDNITLYKTSEMKGEVVQKIPDLWSATRSRSLSDPQATELTPRDFILPIILVGFLIIMTVQPVLKRIRRVFLK